MNHHDVNVSIGDGLRPGFPHGGTDANDEALKKGMEEKPKEYVENYAKV